MADEDRRLYNEIARRLAGIRTAWRFSAALRGLLCAAVLLIVPTAVALAADAGGYVRPAVLALAAAAGAAALAAGFLWPLVRPFDLRDAAFLAERKLPRLGGRVASSVELWRETMTGEFVFDKSYLSALLAETAAEMRSVTAKEVLNNRKTLYFAGAFFAAAALAAALVLATGSAPGKAMSFVSPPYLPRPEVYRLDWVTGNVVVPTGGTARIAARCSGNFSGAPKLVLERDGLEPYEIEFKKEESKKAESLRFAAAAPSITGETTYKVVFKQHESKSYKIKVVEPPGIKSMAIRLTYPEYTGLLPEDRTGGGDLRVPYGTKAEFRVVSTSPLESAYLRIGGRRVTLEPGAGGTSAAGSLIVKKSGRYTVNLVDTHGFGNPQPPEYSIESVPDAKPEVTLIKPETDMNLSRDSVVPVRVDARDDYGVARIELHARVVGAKGAMSMPVRIRPGREMLFDFVWKLGDMEVFDGDTIEYYVSATDNDALTGPKTTSTVSRRIHILSRFEDFQKTQKDQQDIINRMESLMSEGDSISEKFQDLAQNMNQAIADGKRKQWQAEAQRALDRQSSLEKEMSEISESMQSTIERMKGNDFVNLETVQKLQELNRLMNDIMTDELKDLLNQIRKQVENVDLSGVDRKMLEAMKDQKKMNDSIDQTIRRLKRMKMEQRLDALRDHYRELTARQERLLNNTKELDRATGGKKCTGPQKDEAARQTREEARVQDETAAESEAMRELSKDMKEVSPDTADDLKDLLEQTEKRGLQNDLGGARENLGMCKLKSAARNEKGALDTMKRVSDSLDKMQQSFQASMQKRTKDMIRAALRKTLDISEAHGDAAEATKRLAAQPERNGAEDKLNEISGDEKMTAEAAVALAEEVGRLAAFSMEVPTSAPALAAEAAQSINNAVAGIGDQQYDVAMSNQRNATLRLNQLAAALLEAKAQAGQPSAMSEWDSYLQQLQRLAESQSNLNSATQRMSDSGLPMPQMGQGLQALAAQQQMLREGLGKLAEDMKNVGESSERLSQIGADMQEVQRMLTEGRADKQVIRRQANVLRRIQDLTLSIRKESLDQKRVAEQPKAYTPAAPAGMPAGLVRDSLPEPVKNELNRLKNEPAPPGYKQLIDSYYRELLRTEGH